MSDSSSSNWWSTSDSEQDEDAFDDNQMEENLFDFSQIPFELQCSIVEKFKPKAFITFDESSRLGHSICWSKLHWIKLYTATLHVDERKIRLKVVDDDFYGDEYLISYEDACGSPFRIKTDEIFITEQISRSRIKEVTSILEKHQTTTMGVILHGNIAFEPSDLEELIMITRAYMFWCEEFLPREFLRLPCLQVMKHLEVNDTGCTDEELLLLKASHLSLKGKFTLRGVRGCLKQWRKNERKIEFLQLQFDKSFSSRDIEFNLEGLDANPVWIPALHIDSILAPLPRENVRHMGSNDPEHIYSLWKPEKLDRGLLLELRSTFLYAEKSRGEAEYLLQYLDNDQYYKVTKECRMCRTQFCEHRQPIPSEEM